MALTRRQKDVMDFLADFIRSNGYSPSFEEIAEGLGLASIATVHKHLTALESKRYLKRGYNQSRALDFGPQYYREMRLKREESAAMAAPEPETPLLGSIAAGLPIETYPDPETISFRDFVGDNNVYALRVRGDSMIDDHIMDGDYVLVQKTDSVREGDIVVALLGGTESTLKRFYKEPGDKARLQPANAEMAPIIVALADLEIQGRVLAIHRRYR